MTATRPSVSAPQWMVGLVIGSTTTALLAILVLLIVLWRGHGAYGPSLDDLSAMPAPPPVILGAGDGSVESAVQQAIGMQLIIVETGSADAAGMVPVDLQFAGLPCRATLMSNGGAYTPVALTCSR